MANLKHLILFALLLFFAVISMHSCYYDNEEYLYSSGACSDTVYTYTGRVKAIMEQNCAISGCHTGPSPEDGLALDNYADVKNSAETGNFFCTIYWSSGCSAMPKNASKLDNCTINALEEWKTRNYPEN